MLEDGEVIQAIFHAKLSYKCKCVAFWREKEMDGKQMYTFVSEYFQKN